MAARAGEVAGSRAAGFPVKYRAVWQPGSEAYDLASGGQAAGRQRRLSHVGQPQRGGEQIT